MQLDHVFCFVPSERAAEIAVDQLGLVETYRRKHPGQGTSNICCCFDNAFLEFLWLTDENEARLPNVARMGLFERSQSASIGSCPFGIAWRGEATHAPPMWSYTPSYLPAGMSIAVLAESDDWRLPLVFQSPGNSGPLQWPVERRGMLQHANGQHRIIRASFSVPPAFMASEMMSWLSDCRIVSVVISADNSYGLTLDIGDDRDVITKEIKLPISDFHPQ